MNLTSLTLAISTKGWLALVYLLAAVLFIFGLKMLSKVKTAPRGNLTSAIGMLLAVAATFFYIQGGEWISLVWILIAIAVGAAVGTAMALKVPMTGMPQMVAIFNGFGGIASLLVACADFAGRFTQPVAEALRERRGISLEAAQNMLATADLTRGDSALQIASWDSLLATGLATLIGGVTFTGSMIAWGKLSEAEMPSAEDKPGSPLEKVGHYLAIVRAKVTGIVPDQPVQLPGQKVVTIGLLVLALVLAFTLINMPAAWWAVLLIAIFALTLGVLLVIGIGGADMPVVIALLNSYSGLAAAMAGFVLENFALIITGALVGASGLILTSIMCKAMNRSLLNVLFGGFGAATGGATVRGKEHVHAFSPEDAAIRLEAARSVMFVPGYGMAVAQAQHSVKELADELQRRGIEVRYAIHPVAGRMPGHMNVLLAEAGVPYEQLLDLEQANPEFPKTDVAIVIGANDVTNPAARNDENSPIYGMPILDVDQTQTCFVIKRSLSPGFAGIDNELFYHDNTGMIFGDGKSVANSLVNELQQL
jgi:NAD(P) transhydrogenase subunit beta